MTNKNSYTFTFIILSIFALTACTTDERSAANTTKSEIHTYSSSGTLMKIDTDLRTITIDHEVIPGYMEAMVMTEPVADSVDLKGFSVGDIVSFDLQRTGADLLITTMNRSGVDRMVKAAEIYTINCAECHGAKGEGADKGIPFTSGHALHHTEAEFVKTVTYGKKRKNKNEMPAYKDKLTDEEIKYVVEYVRNVIQKDAVPDKSANDHHNH